MNSNKWHTLATILIVQQRVAIDVITQQCTELKKFYLTQSPLDIFEGLFASIM